MDFIGHTIYVENCVCILQGLFYLQMCHPKSFFNLLCRDGTGLVPQIANLVYCERSLCLNEIEAVLLLYRYDRAVNTFQLFLLLVVGHC